MIENKFDEALPTFTGDLDDLPEAQVSLPKDGAVPSGLRDADDREKIRASEFGVQRIALLNAFPLLNKLYQVKGSEPIEKVFDEVCSECFVHVHQTSLALKIFPNTWEYTKLFEIFYDEAIRQKFAGMRVIDLAHFAEQVTKIQKSDSTKALVLSIQGNKDVVLSDDDLPIYTYSEIYQKIISIDRALNTSPLIAGAQGDIEKSTRKAFIFDLIHQVSSALSKRFDLSLFGRDRAISERALVARSFDVCSVLLQDELYQNPSIEWDEELEGRVSQGALEILNSQMDSIDEYARTSFDSYKEYVNEIASQGLSDGHIQPVAGARNIAQAHRIDLNGLKCLTWAVCAAIRQGDMTGDTYNSMVADTLSNTPKLAHALFGLHSGFVRAKASEMLMYQSMKMMSRSGAVLNQSHLISEIDKIGDAEHFHTFAQMMAQSNVFKFFDRTQYTTLPSAFADVLIKTNVELQRVIRSSGLFKNREDEVCGQLVLTLLKTQKECEPTLLNSMELNDAVYLKRALLQTSTQYLITDLIEITSKVRSKIQEVEAKKGTIPAEKVTEMILAKDFYQGVGARLAAHLNLIESAAIGYAEKASNLVAQAKQRREQVAEEVDEKSLSHDPV